MKKVYESSTALEAHMLKNLLVNEDIESRIDGEYLQGGVGELQAIGVVRLMVEDSGYPKAKGIIDQWESNQTKNIEVKTKKTSSVINGFAFGVILTAGVSYYIFNSPVTNSGIDYNDDGFLDELWTYNSNRAAVAKYDRNFDKKYDYIYYYDSTGLLKSAEGDENFDGVFEAELLFRNGNTIREDSDKNQNGIKDYRAYYKYGVLDTIEILDETTGKVRKRQYYKMNKLVSADFDSNGDGNLDIHYEYDHFEERK